MDLMRDAMLAQRAEAARILAMCSREYIRAVGGAEVARADGIILDRTAHTFAQDASVPFVRDQARRKKLAAHETKHASTR
jgi:predicted protein tyrosine phosphatase